jgi:penicillin-binding protein 1A
LLYQRKGASNGKVIEPQYLAMMNMMMQETLLTGTARKGELPGWQAAGKTGTSQDWRDAWFIGYTSHLVTGVWLGNDDNSPTKKASGGTLPVEIWSRFMKLAHQGVPPQALPGGIWQPPQSSPIPLPGFLQAPQEVEAVPAPRSLTEAVQSPALPNPQMPVPQATQNINSSTRGEPRDNRILPPGLIPNGSMPRKTAPQQERGFFDQLFGG